MKKSYRSSLPRIVALTLIGFVIAFAVAIGNPRPLGLFFWIASAFLVLGMIAWAYTAIRFEGDEIVRTIFFVVRSTRPLSSIRRVRFDADVDSFGGRTSYMTIEFRTGKPFLLFDVSRDDLREIADRISAVPGVIDPSLTAQLNRKEVALTWTGAFRANPVVWGGGALFVIIAALWWFFNH